MSDRTVIGLHLGDTALRRARVRRVGRSVEVSFAELPAPRQGGATAGTAAPVDGLLRVAAVPGHAVMSRSWRFPRADSQTMRQMIANRLEAELPLALDKLRWGYRRAAQAAADGSVPVFVQAARADQVERQMDLLADGEQPVDLLTTEAEALQGLYRHGLRRPEGRPGLEVLVVGGPDAWLLAVLSDGMVQSLRRIAVSARRVELAVRECCQALDSLPDRQELQRIWWLAGRDAGEARQCLAEQANVPVEVALPAETLISAAGKRLEVPQLAEYALALGLALAGLHEAEQVIRLAGRDPAVVSPRQERVDRLLAMPVRWAVAAGLLLVLALVAHVWALHSETGRMERVLAAERTPGVPGFASKLQAMQRLQAYRIDVERIVGEVAQAVPDSIVLSSIQLSRERKLVIKGTAKDPKAAYALAEALRKCSRFQAVNPERTEPGQGGTFTISMEVSGVNPLVASGKRGGTWR